MLTIVHFNNAVELLQDIGITLPTGPECHSKVRQILDQANDEELINANLDMATLRQERNNADYRLSNNRYDKKSFAATNLKAAARIIACIKIHLPSSGNDALHQTLRTYAKDVLKLTVT